MALAMIVALAQEPLGAREIFRRCAGSVVAVRGLTHLGERSGSGVVLTADGLILASTITIPPGSERVRVWLKGPKLYPAEIVAASKEDEVTLLRIKPEAPLTPIALGRSAGVAAGQTVFSIGNAQNSFINDDQPSIQRGLVSSRYTIAQPVGGATFRGDLLETTAAVNEHMEGAPLLNAQGQMIGMVTLNYTPSRWLGHALPIDWVNETVDRLRKDAGESAGAAPPPEGAGSLGMTLVERDGKLWVASVEPDGPAAVAGLRKGDRILQVGGRPVAVLPEIKAGALVEVTATSDGDKFTVKLRAVKKEAP